MFNKLNVEKEKLLANISPLVIYIVSAILFVSSIISCEVLYHSETNSQFIWAVIAIAISMLEWFTALTGFYSYIYSFKYDVKKSFVFVIVCYLMIILGIVSFYLVFKIMP